MNSLVYCMNSLIYALKCPLKHGLIKVFSVPILYFCKCHPSSNVKPF